MLDLAERIRDYVDTASPTVTLDEIEGRLGQTSVGTPPDHRLRRPMVLIGAGVLVVLAVALVVQLIPGSSSNTGTEADAALSQAASVAAARPARVTPGPGQYLYYETTELVQSLGPPAPVGTRQFLFEATKTTQTWVAPDGSGRQRIVIGPPSLVFPADAAAWKAAGSPTAFLPVGGDTLYPSNHAPNGGPLVQGADGQYFLAYPDSSKFPTQPDALQKYMGQYYEITGGPTTTFLLAGNVLEVGASPALRSAIFQLIEDLHGVVLLGPTKDPAGRTGTGVAIDGFGNRYILIFDPTTSAVLGEKIVSTTTVTQAGQMVPSGTLVGSTTFGTTGIASSTTTLPNGSSAPPV